MKGSLGHYHEIVIEIDSKVSNDFISLKLIIDNASPTLLKDII